MFVYNTLAHRNTFFKSWDEAYRLWYHSSRSAHYAYYAICLNCNAWIPFQTKEELMAWWQENRSFDDQNLTGNDTFVYHDPYHMTRSVYLRNTQVQDEYGRIINMRDLLCNNYVNTDVIHDPYHCSWKYSGRRNHSHRKKGPSMYRRSLQAALMPENKEYRLPCKTAFKNNGDVWDYYEDAHANDWSSSKCWKDQTKASKQYWKHKGRTGRRIVPDPEPLELIADRIFSGEISKSA